MKQNKRKTKSDVIYGLQELNWEKYAMNSSHIKSLVFKIDQLN